MTIFRVWLVMTIFPQRVLNIQQKLLNTKDSLGRQTEIKSNLSLQVEVDLVTCSRFNTGATNRSILNWLLCCPYCDVLVWQYPDNSLARPLEFTNRNEQHLIVVRNCRLLRPEIWHATLEFIKDLFVSFEFETLATVIFHLRNTIKRRKMSKFLVEFEICRQRTSFLKWEQVHGRRTIMISSQVEQEPRNLTISICLPTGSSLRREIGDKDHDLHTEITVGLSCRSYIDNWITWLVADNKPWQRFLFRVNCATKALKLVDCSTTRTFITLCRFVAWFRWEWHPNDNSHQENTGG